MKEEWVLNQSQGVASSHKDDKIANTAEILSIGYAVFWYWCRSTAVRLKKRERPSMCQWGALREQLERHRLNLRCEVTANLRKLFFKWFVSVLSMKWVFCIYFVAENRRVQSRMTDNSFVPLSMNFCFQWLVFGLFSNLRLYITETFLSMKVKLDQHKVC